MSSFTTVSVLSNFTWDLFEETNVSTMDLSFCAVDDDAPTDDERPVAVTVDDIALFHLVSGASNYEITKVEENCNIDTKPQLVVPSAVSDDDGDDDDNLSSISDWSSLFDESDDDDDMSSFTTVSELSNFTWDLFEETNVSTMDLSFCAVDDDGVDNYTIAQMLLEQLLYEIV
eukprot:XP_011678695.1 PREDICTED: uncharacterized protein LOC105445185 [Strongylocentrotus purpuratus]